jgi:hypothetical protein
VQRWRTKCAMACVSIVFACVMGAESPRTRVMRAGEQPIVERLLPDDEVVLISPDYDVVVPDHVLSAAEAIADATARADLVAVVAVDDVKAILVDNGAWIRTRLSGLITRVLSASLHGQALSKRKRVDVYITGGELRIGQVLVKAGNPLKLPAARHCCSCRMTEPHPGLDRHTRHF